SFRHCPILGEVLTEAGNHSCYSEGGRWPEAKYRFGHFDQGNDERNGQTSSKAFSEHAPHALETINLGATLRIRWSGPPQRKNVVRPGPHVPPSTRDFPLGCAILPCSDVYAVRASIDCGTNCIAICV
ncbi:hypothetical protein, partial [Paracoccus sp. (in: a-proteobacteria)]|uniref:hypothetical protein n=1 Tax=Paracoccus sp. TaxID=267 RepID=UPI00333FABA8